MARKTEQGIAVPPLGNVVSGGKQILDLATGIPSIARELHSLGLTWKYRHNGLRLKNPNGMEDGDKVYQIKTDAKDEADRLVLMARVQAVRWFEKEHPEIEILSSAERDLIDVLDKEDAAEKKLLETKSGKKTIGEKMYADSDGSNRTGERSVAIEIIAAGRQARHLMKADAIADERFFNIDEANLLTSIDAHKRQLADLLYAEVDSNAYGAKRVRLNEIFDAYRDAASELEADPMKLIRNAAKDFAKATREDDEYIAKANSSESVGALVDGVKRGALFIPSILWAVISHKDANVNNIFSVFDKIDFTQFGSMLQHGDVIAALAIIGLPVALTLSGVAEAGARFVTDKYQEHVGRVKTKYRDAGVTEKLNQVAQDEFGILMPSNTKRRGRISQLVHDRMHA